MILSPQKKKMMTTKTPHTSTPKGFHPVLERVGKAVAEGMQAITREINLIQGENGRLLVTSSRIEENSG
jgi:hypothetical protein